ncbi:MAG TPA: SDR family oxidoreductase [Chitinophagaceae bacterium]|nr:SDR family oxidoreductase [Chitinophagaceae bacterium]
MKKILVTGANGFLGQHLVQLLVSRNYPVVALGRGPARWPGATEGYKYYDVDITNDYLVNAVFQEEQPHTVVHAAAMTQADECQQQQEACEAVNVRATAQVLLSAEACCRHFIYISTDFVFDGEKGDYSEEDDLNPVNWYGFTKVQAEAVVQTSEIPFAIIRTCLLFGNTVMGTRSNIIRWVKDSLTEGKPIKVVSDQWRTPTLVTDLARGILQVIEQEAQGIYHISGADKLTPYAMALQTAALCGLNSSLITEVNAASFTQPAKRPLKTGFNISKAREQLGYQPTAFATALEAMLREG